MSRRIDVELTSSRDDGSWTWRAAGARQPKGTLDGSILPPDAKVGAVLRVEVETDIDGTNVLSVVAGKQATPGPQLLELLGSGREEPLVTTVLAPKGRGRSDRGDRGPRRDRGPRPDGERGRGPRPDGDRGRGPRPDGDRRGPRRDGEARRDGRPGGAERRPRPDAAPPRPKAKRLRPGRTHRNAVVASLAPEERPIAEQVLRAGIPGVRQGIEKQNEQARAEGRPEVRADALVALAEQLQPRLRVAEWHDRAEAALAEIDELDLRDLRTVVVAADGNTRDEETRALAEQLRTKLAERVEAAQQEWLTDLRAAVAEGRVVRALKISSRPPKAGVPVPADLLAALTEAATAALTPEAGQDRWRMVIEALAFSPVHASVAPTEIPATPGDELLAVVRKSASRVPALAAKFGVEVPAPGARRPRRPPRPPKPPTPTAAPAAAAPSAPAATPTEPPAPEAPTTETPAAEVATADVPSGETPAPEAAAEAPGVEAPRPAAEPTPAPPEPSEA